MSTQTKSIQLTQLQISHAIVALQDHMKNLLILAENNPEGGEHEDYLIAQSVLKQLASAKE